MNKISSPSTTTLFPATLSPRFLRFILSALFEFGLSGNLRCRISCKKGNSWNIKFITLIWIGFMDTYDFQVIFFLKQLVYMQCPFWALSKMWKNTSYCITSHTLASTSPHRLRFSQPHKKRLSRYSFPGWHCLSRIWASATWLKEYDDSKREHLTNLAQS